MSFLQVSEKSAKKITQPGLATKNVSFLSINIFLARLRDFIVPNYCGITANHSTFWLFFIDFGPVCSFIVLGHLVKSLVEGLPMQENSWLVTFFRCQYRFIALEAKSFTLAIPKCCSCFGDLERKTEPLCYSTNTTGLYHFCATCYLFTFVNQSEELKFTENVT